MKKGLKRSVFTSILLLRLIGYCGNSYVIMKHNFINEFGISEKSFYNYLTDINEALLTENIPYQIQFDKELRIYKILEL